MNQNYTIDLNPSDNELELFELNDENLAEVKIQLPGLQVVSGDNYKVIINLSADAMLGLGAELIRKALRLKGSSNEESVSEFEYVQPLSLSNTCEKLGIYLAPTSCELLMAAKNFGKVEDMITALKNK